MFGIVFSFLVKGYHGDTSKTFLCGKVSDSVQRLVKVSFFQLGIIEPCGYYQNSSEHVEN
ncbi:putative methionyl aminopeptidase [Rosa chinensis]|uniref:Putative methionyl aminopeptidase n=1 Tax=Rosa chinensis TaxID=74649 RepID=A0A2P6RLH9_ROSCH|nr:putative methionyl aminopeptidase [Rosa chinensis]